MEKQTVRSLDLSNVKAGDRFTRMIGGTIPLPVIVGDIDDTYIWVGSSDGLVKPTKESGWQFIRATSTEIDMDNGIDGITATISYLREYNPNTDIVHQEDDEDVFDDEYEDEDDY